MKSWISYWNINLNRHNINAPRSPNCSLCKRSIRGADVFKLLPFPNAFSMRPIRPYSGFARILPASVLLSAAHLWN